MGSDDEMEDIRGLPDPLGMADLEFDQAIKLKRRELTAWCRALQGAIGGIDSRLREIEERSELREIRDRAESELTRILQQAHDRTAMIPVVQERNARVVEELRALAARMSRIEAALPYLPKGDSARTEHGDG